MIAADGAGDGAEHGFYGILTRPSIGYEALAAVMVARRLAYVQLRVKDRPRREIRAIALALRPIVVPPSQLIVNDDPRLAAEIGADGVHLGQDDMPFAEARAIVGPDAVIGLSTHTPGQTQAACALGPSYIGVGPVYATPTKADPDPVIGLGGMRAMLARATAPAVVLGGIDEENLGDVLAAGATTVCAVRAVNAVDDPGAALDRMLAAIRRARGGGAGAGP